MHGAARTYRSSTYAADGRAYAAADGESSDRHSRSARRRTAEQAARNRKKPRRRKDPWWARLCVVLGALLMVGSGGVIVGGKVLIGQATSSIQTTKLIGGPAVVPGSNIKGAINLLLVGIDQRPEDGDKLGARSDTIVIVHIPASHDQAYLVSIPRDLRVDIPRYPKTGYNGGTDKVNAAFEWGFQGPGTELEKRARGVDLLAQTIHQLTGIQFNGAAIIDFVGFEAVIRELGGVNMCVDQRAESIHLAIDKYGNIVPVWFSEKYERVMNMPPGGKKLVYEVGCRRMTAQQALDYSRIRYGLPNTDYDRQRHQQQLIKAIAKEATSTGVLTDLNKLRKVIDAAGKAFILDTQGVPLEDFLFTLKGVAANDLVLVKTNKGTFNGGKIGDVSYENLSPESLDMMHAVRDGTLLQWLSAHPDYLGSTSG